MEATRITVNDAKALYDADAALFVDSRSAVEWHGSDEQIPGAVRVPPDEPELHLNELPRDRTIITYCT